MLGLLQSSSYPPTIELAGEVYYLRYYLANFLLPALLAKSGMSPHIAYYLYALAAHLLVLTLAFQNLRNAKQVWIAVIIFFSFGGLDLIGLYFNNWPFYDFLPDYEWWARLGAVFSNLTPTLLSAHLCIGAWLSTAMLIKYPHLSIRYGGVLGVAMLASQPWVVLGFMPIYLYQAIRHGGIRKIMTVPNFIVTPLLAVPLLLYFSQGTSNLYISWIWQAKLFHALDYVLLFVLEVFVISILLVAMDKTRKKLALTLVCALVAISVVHYGTIENMVLRASIPIVFLWSLWMVESALHGTRRQRLAIATYLLIAAVPITANYLQFVYFTPKVDKQIRLDSLDVPREVYGMSVFEVFTSPKDETYDWLMRQ